MKDYADLPYYNGASFPLISAKTSSGPTTKDGTPFNKQWADEVMGSFQAILLSAQQTPSGSSEEATDSQILRSLQRICGEPGEVVFWAGPSNTSSPFITRLLQLTGQVVTIAAYPDLVENTYIGDGNNADTDYTAFYKCSDSGGLTRNVAGPYFKLPDARGLFVRALTDNRSDGFHDFKRVDDGDQYIQASFQQFETGPHVHDVETDADEKRLDATATWLPTADPGVGYTAKTVYTKSATDSPGGALQTTRYIGYPGTSPFGDAEVRPDNIAFRLMIRY